MERNINEKDMVYRAPIFKDTTREDIKWQDIEPANVDRFFWEIQPYRPLTQARLATLDEGIAVCMRSWEKELRITEDKPNGNVYEDSCMEFFFQPDPTRDTRYFVIEVNPRGTLLLGTDDADGNFQTIDEAQTAPFEIRVTIQTKKWWQVEYLIPYDFIIRYFPNYEAFQPARGNFFKCGDLCRIPHYGCWSPVNPDEMNFHKEEYFGDILFIIL